MHMKEKFVVCACGSLSHILRLQYFFWKDTKNNNIDIDLYFGIFLNPELSFWKRLYYGLRYIIGSADRLSLYEEVVIDERKAQEIIDFLTQFQQEKKEFEKGETN